MTTSVVLEPTNNFFNALIAVLDGAAKEIKRFVASLHNRCPLVVYVNQSGKVCSQFLKRSAFTGYHFRFTGNEVIVTNKESGAQYRVSLKMQFCSCKRFIYSPLPKQSCKHIKMVAELRGDSTHSAAQSELNQYIEQQAEEIAPITFKIGDLVEINSDRHGAEYDWQTGTVTAIHSLGTTVEILGVRKWFYNEELVMVRAANDRAAVEDLFPAENLSAVRYNPNPIGLRGAAANWEARMKSGRRISCGTGTIPMEKWQEIAAAQKLSTASASF